MASISCWGRPFSACLIIIMNRIVISPLCFGFGAGLPERTVDSGLYKLVERGRAGSTSSTVFS
jgi:hypothetical protein